MDVPIEKDWSNYFHEDDLEAMRHVLGSWRGPRPHSDIWPVWDATYVPGLYRFEVIQAESTWLNYFVIGPVDNPLQPEPVHPTQRFPVPNSDIDGAILSKGHGIASEFRIEEGAIVRVESWVVRPEKNPRPLPPGFDSWPGVIVRSRMLGDINTSTPDFDRSWPTLSKRWFSPEGHIAFGADDGGNRDYESGDPADFDFNDLVVRLVRIED